MKKSSEYDCNDVAFMAKDLKTILKEEMERRQVSIPALARALGIPEARIRAWYRDDTNPKAEDAKKIDAWMKGEEISKDRYFTADQLFHMYMKAMERQDTLMAAHTLILNRIESRMALESSLQEVLAGVETIADRQGPAIDKILADLDELKRRKNGS